MILVEADTSEEWDSLIGWAELADKAVRTAIAHSRHDGLLNSKLAAEISVKFTDDEEVRALNAAYRDKDKSTNVLSFPMVEADQLEALAGASGGELLLGDIVLARGVCVAEAGEKGIAVESHAAHLVVHGTLHLLGYDHEIEDGHEIGDGHAENMEKIERAALAAIGIADPYPVTEVQP